MVKKWLNCKERKPCPYTCFKVVDVQETSEPSPEVKSILRDQLKTAYFSSEYFESMAEFLGWKRVKKDIIAKKVPTLPNIKKGDFGEALMVTLLSYFHEYQIPVPKLRFKIIGNQTLPATDFLALKIDKNNSIVEVCFVESKFRGYLDRYAAVNGYNQLQNDYSVRLPNILTFVAERLYERKDVLYESFRYYMRDRKDTTDIDSFHLGLCWERDSWEESVLEKLEENGVNLDILTVSVVCIGGIRNLTEEIFKKLG